MTKSRKKGESRKRLGKRPLTTEQRRIRNENKRKYMFVFINGKQKRVRRYEEQLVEGIPVDEFIARNADPIWLHQNELWELMIPEHEINVIPEDEINAYLGESEFAGEEPFIFD